MTRACPRDDERGSVLVHVALAFAAFIGVSALAIDVGMLLVGRSEIQNAADASALAAATSLAFDSQGEDWAYAPAQGSATAFAAVNLVAGQAPSFTPVVDLTYPECPDRAELDPVGVPASQSCIRVRLHRSVERGNPLHNLFASVFGQGTGSVSAAATAQVKRANATTCLKPLAVPDRWDERMAPGDSFTKYDAANLPLPGPDTYVPPDKFSWGAGPDGALNMEHDAGAPVTIRHGVVGDPATAWSYLPITIPGSAQGSYEADVTECAGAQVTIGDALPLLHTNMEGVVATAMQMLIARDPAAYWDTAAARVEGSCAAAAAPCAAISPRIIALAVYDPDVLADDNLSGATQLIVRNVVGFFVASATATEVSGYLVRYPGVVNPAAPMLMDVSSFLRKVILVE